MSWPGSWNKSFIAVSTSARLLSQFLHHVFRTTCFCSRGDVYGYHSIGLAIVCFGACMMHAAGWPLLVLLYWYPHVNVKSLQLIWRSGTRSTGARSTNELQGPCLKIGHQASSSSNPHPSSMPPCWPVTNRQIAADADHIWHYETFF